MRCIMDFLKLSAFSKNGQGGNPAGVMLCDQFPTDEKMQSIAYEVDFSETVFAMKQDQAWRVRYFSPKMEVDFCGHATIALGGALAMEFGDGDFDLALNKNNIQVQAFKQGGQYFASLTSPATKSQPASETQIAEICALFDFKKQDINFDIAPANIHGGADHIVLVLNEKSNVENMRYDFEQGLALMQKYGWVTIMLVHKQSDSSFYVRNAFAAGGVVEDPATGAAAAAFCGYLRDEYDWPIHDVKLIQGVDVGRPSEIKAQFSKEKTTAITISGEVSLYS